MHNRNQQERTQILPSAEHGMQSNCMCSQYRAAQVCSYMRRQSACVCGACVFPCTQVPEKCRRRCVSSTTTTTTRTTTNAITISALRAKTHFARQHRRNQTHSATVRTNTAATEHRQHNSIVPAAQAPSGIRCRAPSPEHKFRTYSARQRCAHRWCDRESPHKVCSLVCDGSAPFCGNQQRANRRGASQHRCLARQPRVLGRTR